jgi:hypothetical protein
MANNSRTTAVAERGKFLNGALKAIKAMGFTPYDYLKRFSVIVAAVFALIHIYSLLDGWMRTANFRPAKT